MFLQVAFTKEISFTHGTAEGFLSGMLFHVESEIIRAGKFFGTLLTFMNLISYDGFSLTLPEIHVEILQLKQYMCVRYLVTTFAMLVIFYNLLVVNILSVRIQLRTSYSTFGYGTAQILLVARSPSVSHLKHHFV
jgi:hypothetical protein